MTKAKTKTDGDEIVTGPVLAKRLGLTATSVSRLAANGRLVKVSRGRFLAWASARSYLKSVTDSASARQSPVALARAELIQLQVRKAQFSLDREAGKYIDLAETQRYMAAYVNIHRREMMAIPNRVAAEMNLGRAAAVRMEDLFSEALARYVESVLGICAEVERKLK
jgi:hypothetical protein